MRRHHLLTLLLLFFYNSGEAQEYSYTHYGISDGLAGSTVYCITQDNDGFIWVGTETGVSRFDGTNFRNFTTKDGLPDIEVLQIFADSKGRVWMAPFRKSVCFYYKGSIHNEQNDPLLARIHVKGFIDGFAEDGHGNILLQEEHALHLLGNDGSLKQFDSVDHVSIRHWAGVSRSASGNFLVEADQQIYELAGTRFTRLADISFETIKPTFIAMCAGGAVWREKDGRYDILSFSNKQIIHRDSDKLREKCISFSILDDSLVFSNELSGSLEYNINTGQTRRYLEGIPVSRTFRDLTGNLWFTTMGDGIYRLNSNSIKTVRLTVEKGELSNVTAVTKIGNELWVGENHNHIFRYSLPDMDLLDHKPCGRYRAFRILYIDTADNKNILAGGDEGLTKFSSGFQHIATLQSGLKSAFRIDGEKILVGCSWGAAVVYLKDYKTRDTLWRERSTVVFYKDDTSYIGTLNGLYRSVKGRPLEFLGDKIPFLRKRILSITASSDGTLWIASYDDAGIIGIKGDRQVAAITAQQGLTSDIVRILLGRGNTLWVGTDKGLNRVRLDSIQMDHRIQPQYRVTQYTSRDGLASDMINTVFVDGSHVYVGTAAGLSFFDEKEIPNSEPCRLYLLSLINSGRDRIADTGNLIIPYTDKHIRFGFAGISYRSAGDIVYRYRMLGLDSTWRETKQSALEYPELPSGNYELQLVAINKFGSQSRLLNLPVTVSIQFWKRPWFSVFIWLLSLGLLWLLIFYRIRLFRRRHREKERLQQRMSELETIALKSQMNPHFIFNCLNSIQQFIFTGNISASNKYISGLARLIRITLNNSSRSFVSISEEADYLGSYLTLEKMRFKEKIDYELIIDPSIDPTLVQIPPMLIQPHVENALQHGLREKADGKGFISIKITKETDRLVVTIEDNGIGRKPTFIIQTAPHSSKGMSLTQDRISILNKLYGETAAIAITDLKDPNGNPAGTRITLTLPLFPPVT